VLSGRGLCVGLITRPGESYRLWRVLVYDQETSKTRRLKPLPGCENTDTVGCSITPGKQTNNKPSRPFCGALCLLLSGHRWLLSRDKATRA